MVWGHACVKNMKAVKRKGMARTEGDQVCVCAHLCVYTHLQGNNLMNAA